MVAPVLESEPRYLLLLERKVSQGRESEIAAAFQRNLAQLNEEYREKTASGRLLPAQVREVPAGIWRQMRADKVGARGNFEEYKHVCLVQDVSFVDRLLATQEAAAASQALISTVADSAIPAALSAPASTLPIANAG